MLFENKILYAFLLVWGIVPPAMSQSEGHLGTVIEVAPAEVNIEEDKLFVGNDQTVLRALRSYQARPREEDAAVILDLQEREGQLPGPLLIELGRRLSASDPYEGAYYVWLGIARSRAAGVACVDSTAPQFVTVILMEFDRVDSTGLVFANDPEVRLPAYRRLLEEEALFNSQVSSWWVCSHGMMAMMSAMEGDPIALNEWIKPQDEINVSLRRMEDSLERWIQEHQTD